eukprot:g22433.t1
MAQVQAVGSRESLEVYRGYRSSLKKEIRRVKKGHEIALAEKIRVNPKRFFKSVKGKRITRERIGPLKDQSGYVCVEPQEMGEVVTEYFSSVFTVEKDMKTRELGEVKIFDEVTRKVDEGRVVDVVCMDFIKAFDNFPHDGLLWKIRSHESKESWQTGYTIGLMGSVRGPLLFVIYLNDLEENVRGMTSKFVNDTKIGGIVDSEEDYQKLQQDL